MNLFQFPRDISTVGSAKLIDTPWIDISNTTTSGLLIVVLLLIIALSARSKFTVALPGKLQNALEALYESVEGYCRQLTGNSEIAGKIFPLFSTILIFILVSNLLGLVPGLGAITVNGVSLFRTATSDVNTTLAIALVAQAFIHGSMVASSGLFSYLGNYIKIGHVVSEFRKGVKAGLFAIIDLFIGFMDIISEIAKIISLSLRLFGNMYAGDVLMTILIGLIAYLGPAVWLVMSTLSAVVQAVVFASLVAVFYTLSVPSTSK